MPSFIFKNRFFIERNFKTKYIYSNFGYTYKSFSWTFLNTRVLSNFTFLTNSTRLFLIILICLVCLFLLNFYIYNIITSQHSIIFSLIIYIIWRIFDLFYFWIINFLFLFFIIIFTWFFYLLNTLLPLNINIYTLISKHFFSSIIIKQPVVFNFPDTPSLVITQQLNNWQKLFLNNNQIKKTLNQQLPFFKIFYNLKFLYHSTSTLNLLFFNSNNSNLLFFKQYKITSKKLKCFIYDHHSLHSNLINNNLNYKLSNWNSNDTSLILFNNKTQQLIQNFKTNRWLNFYNILHKDNFKIFKNLQHLFFLNTKQNLSTNSFISNAEFFLQRQQVLFIYNNLLLQSQQFLNNYFFFIKKISNNSILDVQWLNSGLLYNSSNNLNIFNNITNIILNSKYNNDIIFFNSNSTFFSHIDFLQFYIISSNNSFKIFNYLSTTQDNSMIHSNYDLNNFFHINCYFWY